PRHLLISLAENQLVTHLFVVDLTLVRNRRHGLTVDLGQAGRGVFVCHVAYLSLASARVRRNCCSRTCTAGRVKPLARSLAMFCLMRSTKVGRLDSARRDSAYFSTFACNVNAFLSCG